MPGRERKRELTVGRRFKGSVENCSTAAANEALRFGQHRVVGDFRKPVGIYVRAIVGERVLMGGDRCQALTDAIRVDHFETFAMLKNTRDGRFARTRKPAYHDQSRRPTCRVARRQLEVAACELTGAFSFRGTHLALEAFQTLDFAAHACAITLVERNEHPEVLITTYFGVDFNQLVGEPRRAKSIEIHCEECDLGSNVAIAQPFAELDAIDHINFVTCKADVLGAQVAVAFMDPAFVGPLIQRSPMSR